MSVRKRLAFGCLAAGLVLAAAGALFPADQQEYFPFDQIKPGMQGYLNTIFAGDKLEQVDLEVIGVIPNALGPKQDIVLVQLKGPHAEHDGVVAGMSGSPVFFDGKLAGALSLKIGIFTKDAIGGVTPIRNELDAEQKPAMDALSASPLEPRYEIPADLARRAGVGPGSYLVPIETPLVASGFYPTALAEFAPQLSGLGLSASPGGTIPPSPSDPQIAPGDMLGMVLVDGDLSLAAGCTVTTIVKDRVFVCGHPILGLGDVQLPMARGYVVMTLASALASTKIMNTGGTVGTFTQDRLTGVVGRLGAGPPMIPVELDIDSPDGKRSFHFQVAQNPRLTPLLVGMAIFNGLMANPLYNESATLELRGTIELHGHTPVSVEETFAPNDVGVPSALAAAAAIQGDFTKIFLNPYEQPQVEKVQLRIHSSPERRAAAIDGAWSEKSEVSPGETVDVKVILRPYRGAPFVKEIPVVIPPQTEHGSLRLLVSDADSLNRADQILTVGPQAELPGLEELIRTMNRERRNDRLYITLLQTAPTLLVEDKRMPNVPLSELNVLDQRRNQGNSIVLWESAVGEWSVPMGQVITGQRYLTITVK